MTGSISSLGIGSGVLTSDVIDQPKAADTANIIDPIDKKIETNNQKQQSYDLLSSYMNTFKGSTFALSNDTLFDNKTVDVGGSAEVSVEAGANVDSFTLERVSLAKKDITKIGALSSTTSPIASAAGVLNLDINGTTYNIDYDTTTTLESLAQSITDIAGTQIDASILETSSGAFSLVLSLKETGANQAITITDTDDGTNGTGSLDAALFDTTVTDGVEVDRYGVMSFDSSVLESKLQSDPESVKTFFAGGVDENGNDITGYFTNLDDKVKQYTGYRGLLSNFDNGLTKDAQNIADSRERAQASLDSRMI